MGINKQILPIDERLIEQALKKERYDILRILINYDCKSVNILYERLIRQDDYKYTRILHECGL